MLLLLLLLPPLPLDSLDALAAAVQVVQALAMRGRTDDILQLQSDYERLFGVERLSSFYNGLIRSVAVAPLQRSRAFLQEMQKRQLQPNVHTLTFLLRRALRSATPFVSAATVAELRLWCRDNDLEAFHEFLAEMGTQHVYAERNVCARIVPCKTAPAAVLR